MKQTAKMILIIALLVIPVVQAETLRDPTLPPAVLGTNKLETSSPVIAGPVLQSVMIGEHYRAAIISGQKVMLGKKYEQATLIKLNEHEAVLRHHDGSTLTLTMNYVTVEKKITSPSTLK